MTVTKRSARLAALAGLACALILPAGVAQADKTLGDGYSTWTDEGYRRQIKPGKGPVGGQWASVCVDPAYGAYGRGKPRHHRGKHRRHAGGGRHRYSRHHGKYGPYITVTSIREALDLVAPGGLIEVKPGAVAESLLIRKPVELRAGDCLADGMLGRGWNHYLRGPAAPPIKAILRPTILASADQRDRACLVVAVKGRVILAGFRLGPIYYGRAPCVVQASGELLMSDNIVHGTPERNAISLEYGSAWLLGNTISGARTAIAVMSTGPGNMNKIVINHNQIATNRTGILIRSRVPVEIFDNQISNNDVAGVRVLRGFVDIRSNRFTENLGTALSVRRGSRAHASDNKFVYNATAVRGRGLNSGNFRFNYISCNERAGVRAISTNVVTNNPVDSIKGWFSSKKKEKANAYCAELAGPPPSPRGYDGGGGEDYDMNGADDYDTEGPGGPDENGAPDGGYRDNGNGFPDNGYPNGGNGLPAEGPGPDNGVPANGNDLPPGEFGPNDGDENDVGPPADLGPDNGGEDGEYPDEADPGSDNGDENGDIPDEEEPAADDSTL